MARILLIDDELLVLESIKFMLEDCGHAVDTARHGAQALYEMTTKPYDLVISDVVMPELDGLQFLREARRKYPDARFLVISGGGRRSVDDYLDEASAIGADAVLSKPFKMDELMTAVAAALA